MGYRGRIMGIYIYIRMKITNHMKLANGLMISYLSDVFRLSCRSYFMPFITVKGYICGNIMGR
jgi:hypothetical protein